MSDDEFVRGLPYGDIPSTPPAPGRVAPDSPFLQSQSKKRERMDKDSVFVDHSSEDTVEVDTAEEEQDENDDEEYTTNPKGEAEETAAVSKATKDAFHYPVHVPLSEGGLADLQLSYVAGSLAVAESELVAQGVPAVLSDTVPKYLAYVARLSQSAMDAEEGAEYLRRLLRLLESLTNSMRNLAVADPLTQWNEAALSVLMALDATHPVRAPTF